MSHIFNDPADFVDEMIDGLVAASGRWLRRVPGGVARAQAPAPGTVAVIIGGGSGHYPAFGGLVGSGLAHGAVLGNLFASPSAQQAYNVARSCETGAGVLFSYGNYAGDVLNFDEAERRLIAEGIGCATVRVTDDISSAFPDQIGRRRGIAGDLAVFKVASAAADAGADLATVTTLASRANARTRSMGVAFSGCTFPGAAAPLFTVPAGRMAVGMGVHGEPGIREAAVPTAADLADLLVNAVLAEAPADAGGDADTGPGSVRTAERARVAVILNGLGSVKYEEIFVLYRTVDALLRRAGLHPVDPEVGELVTSLDMAGVSLTLMWLDDELERLWRAPADCPGYRKQATDAIRSATLPQYAPTAAAVGDDLQIPARASAGGPIRASRESAAAAEFACRALAAADDAVELHVEELGRLDAIAGDGDHGLGMQRGVRAARQAAQQVAGQGAGLRTVVAAAAAAWADNGGGTSGALWGALLGALAGELDDWHAPSADALSLGVRAGADAVHERGHAELGDKTMLDALVPIADKFASALAAGLELRLAWQQAAAAGEAAAAATAALVPRIGRARPHAQRSVGSPDPGAVSLALVARAVLAANSKPAAAAPAASARPRPGGTPASDTDHGH